LGHRSSNSNPIAGCNSCSITSFNCCSIVVAVATRSPIGGWTHDSHFH
jgi:hypothetical protein